MKAAEQLYVVHVDTTTTTSSTRQYMLVITWVELVIHAFDLIWIVCWMGQFRANSTLRGLTFTQQTPIIPRVRG